MFTSCAAALAMNRAGEHVAGGVSDADAAHRSTPQRPLQAASGSETPPTVFATSKPQNWVPQVGVLAYLGGAAARGSTTSSPSREPPVAPVASRQHDKRRPNSNPPNNFGPVSPKTHQATPSDTHTIRPATCRRPDVDKTDCARGGQQKRVGPLGRLCHLGRLAKTKRFHSHPKPDAEQPDQLQQSRKKKEPRMTRIFANETVPALSSPFAPIRVIRGQLPVFSPHRRLNPRRTSRRQHSEPRAHPLE